MSKLTANQRRWQSIIDDCNQSGLTQAEYCRQHNLNPQQFYAWKHQLKVKQQSAKNGKTGTFLPVVVEQSTPEFDSILRIQCHGVNIEVTQTTDPELLKRTIQWLGGLS